VSADIVLVFLLAGGFVLGFFRGLVRQALVIGAWAVLFVAAAYLRVPIGEWLAASAPQLGRDYSLMFTFAAIFLGLFSGAVLLLEFGGSPSRLAKHPAVDDALGGVVGLLAAALLVHATMVILDSYFVRAGPTPAPGELLWLREVQGGLDGSFIAQLIADTVGRVVNLLLSPLMPADVRSVMI
jgi:uncharacterized membrane protein required for colicin V production